MSRLGIATALLLLCSLGLVATSEIRRVGDGVEYWAMAEQLASFHLPSATRADILRLERDARRIGHGFEASPLRFPHLVGTDGRQDFPHFWLYPLVNVPALWLTRLAGAHPNWAFTLTNCLLLACAFIVVSREASIAWAVLLLAGPPIWWLDKAHGDVFTVSLLAAACALWRRAPHVTLVLTALAAAQNPALVPIWALVALAAVRTLQGRSEPARLMIVGVLLGALAVTLPLAYYFVRLHVWSPLAGYMHPTWPSLRTMASFVADPNVGLLPNVPFFGVAVAWTIAATIHRRRRLASPAPPAPPAWRDWLLLAGAWGLLLAAFAQSVNLNHGATPGMNRWTLWLMPWLLLVVPVVRAQPTTAATPDVVSTREEGPLAEPARGLASGRTMPVMLMVLAVLNTVWAVWFFRPSLPEVYRYPTRAAAWLWTHAPAWYSPAPEIFAERVSHREPPVLPAAWEGCTKVLTIGGQWPAPCLPPARVPSTCLAPEVLCYAASSSANAVFSTDDRATFVTLGAAPFPSTLASRRWSAAQPFVATLQSRLAPAVAAGARDPHLTPRALSESAVRATDGVGWVSVWMRASTIAVYLDTVSPGASLQLRVDADYHGALIDLDTDRALATVEVVRSGERPTPVVLPAAAAHALVSGWSEPRRRRRTGLVVRSRSCASRRSTTFTGTFPPSRRCSTIFTRRTSTSSLSEGTSSPVRCRARRSRVCWTSTCPCSSSKATARLSSSHG